MPTGEAPIAIQIGVLVVVLLAIYGFAQLVFGPSEAQLRDQHYQWFRESYACRDHGNLIICQYP